MHISENCLFPTFKEQVARRIGDLRMGLPCMLRYDGGRVILASVETLGQARFDALQARCGQPELVLTSHRAQSIMTPAASATIADATVRILPPENADLSWFVHLADPQFDKPGKVTGPLHVIRETATPVQDLAIQLVKTAELIPTALLFTLPFQDSADDLGMAPLDVAAALVELTAQPTHFPVSAAHLPLEVHDTNRLHVFRDPDGRSEHYAIEIGHPDRAAPVLSRLHSACFTGDVLGSLKCDCGPQLQTALARMGEEGAGVLLYLNQEGRGIGLANKMRVYDLQSHGFDTVEANHRLGFKDDERDFRTAAKILHTLGFKAVRLLTNNPAKADMFRENGITITEQLPLRVPQNIHNQNYLAVKALKSGHIL